MKQIFAGKIINRFLVLGLLTACLFVFGYSDKIEITSFAAECMQTCETNQFQCMDNCYSACDEDMTDTDCHTCVITCHSEFLSCMRHAVWCENEVSNPGICQVGYGDHYDYPGGTSTHAGYFLVCDSIVGQCVKCPDHEYCVGTNGLPPCP